MACSIVLCAYNTRNGGSLANHLASCRKKRKLQDAAVAAAAMASAVGKQTHDEQGRIMWLRDHNDVCENRYTPGQLLLCSHGNTAWHRRFTDAATSEPPAGDWMCALCVQAETDGEDMMDHDLEGEEDAVDGAGFDRSTVHADDEEGKTDTSEAEYDKADILPYPPSIWDATTSAALMRVFARHAPPPVTTATVRQQLFFRGRWNCARVRSGRMWAFMSAVQCVYSAGASKIRAGACLWIHVANQPLFNVFSIRSRIVTEG